MPPEINQAITTVFERLVADRVLEAHHAILFHSRVEERGWSEEHAAARAIDADAVFLQFFHGPD